MKKLFGWSIKASIAAVVSVLVLSLFTLVYSYTGVHITNESGATDYKWESNQFRANMAEGFSWLKVNEDGFNNSFGLEEVNDIDILLMGSSHMEAMNVAQNKNVSSLLNELLPDYITYNIGISGHTIYQCAKNLPRAIGYYNPSKYVIIETDRISLDKTEMVQMLNESLGVIPSHDKGISFMIQKYIPCVLPVYREVSNWIRAGQSSCTEDEMIYQNEKDTNNEEYSAILDSFIGKIAEAASECKIIIVYQPGTAIDGNGSMLTEDKESVKKFANACEEHGILFVDMYDDFLSEFVNTHCLAHGFANTAVGVGHLNETGHRLIAERLSAVIKEMDHELE